MDTDTMEAASILTTEKTNDTRSPSIEAAIEAILTKKRLKENSFTGKELLINKRKKQGGNHINKCCQLKLNYFAKVGTLQQTTKFENNRTLSRLIK